MICGEAWLGQVRMAVDLWRGVARRGLARRCLVRAAVDLRCGVAWPGEAGHAKGGS